LIPAPVWRPEHREPRVWLLAGAVGGVAEFLITHEFRGQMLGSRRATVTLSAGILQAAGFIKYRRGVVTIVRLRLHDKDGNRVTATRVSEGEWDYEAPPGERVFLLSGRWQDNELLVGPVIAHVFVVSEADTEAREVTLGSAGQETFTFDLLGLRPGPPEQATIQPEDQG